ncbi:MAG: hypothetical protein KDB22_28885 [Planctomycetales bacterium]|nr:hypothetical protein [Planctomycetales bacterium]
MSTIEPPLESEILSRVILPHDGSLSSEAAEALLKLQFPEEDTNRMNELAGKNRLGELSDSERDEMTRYSRVGNLLSLLRSKARQSLKND